MATNSLDNPNLSCSTPGVGRSTKIYKPGENDVEAPFHRALVGNLTRVGTWRGNRSRHVVQRSQPVSDGVEQRAGSSVLSADGGS